ncbi:hypothetical protein DL89DRAFT_266356 [Linderina pennispora]|uniref:C2H2-type domain-containing protein n=1 Tax=Linderina pennispora TaxID=61395 RepID=A0A1Y1WCS5_9FUNG|nr:uncharacterized protein DL89DRAFT_266356 [Linderina pennispora]ORX71343.1 hypothetical protein DL89DRAFT_266356 [Linderina pennispora]
MNYDHSSPYTSTGLSRKKYTHHSPAMPIRWYGCDECNLVFDGYHKLKRHRITHQSHTTYQFPITQEKRVLCLSPMLNSHKFRCGPCMAEAHSKRFRHVAGPSSPLTSQKKSDIGYIIHPAAAMSAHSPEMSSTSSAGSVFSDDLFRVGLSFHQPSGLLICHLCKRVVVNPRLREHFTLTASACQGTTTFIAARLYLRSFPRKVYNIKTAKEWIESLNGQAIEKIPGFPVTSVSKCAICGYLCKSGTLKDHFTKAHRGTPSAPHTQITIAQQLFSTIMLPKYVEVRHDPDMAPP